MGWKDYFKNPSNTKLLGIFIIITLFMIVPMLFRTLPFIGLDSYAYTNYICGITENIPANTPELGLAIFNLIPCDQYIIYIILFMLILFSSFIFAKIGSKYNKNYGWLTGILIHLGMASFSIFMRIETEVFALPFIALTWYFLEKSNIKNTFDFKDRNIYISIIFFIIAGLIWKGSIFFIFLFLILSRFHIFYIGILGFAILNFKTFIRGLIPFFVGGFNSGMIASENMILIGLFNLIVFIAIFKKEFRIPKYEIAFWIYLAIAMLNNKLSCIILFISAVNLPYRLNNYSKFIKNYVVIIGLIVFISLCISNSNVLPGDDVYNSIEVYQSIDSNNFTKQVNWDFGYVYTWMTEKPTKYYGSLNRAVPSYKNYITLTNISDTRIPEKGCTKLYEEGMCQIVKCE